ncbi:hypothetical protein BH09MYX1_BH09MYX1_64580 [soil metagenome]
MEAHRFTCNLCEAKCGLVVKPSILNGIPITVEKA